MQTDITGRLQKNIANKTFGSGQFPSEQQVSGIHFQINWTST